MENTATIHRVNVRLTAGRHYDDNPDKIEEYSIKERIHSDSDSDENRARNKNTNIADTIVRYGDSETRLRYVIWTYRYSEEGNITEPPHHGLQQVTKAYCLLM